MRAEVHLRDRSRWPILFLCVCLLPLIAPADMAVEPLTLDAAIRMALARNASLARGALGIDRQRLNLRAEEEAFAPEVTPYGNLYATDDGPDNRYGLRASKALLWGTEIGLGAEVARYPSFVDEPWRSAVKVDVRQPLFHRFGRLVNKEGITAAHERLRAETRRWELQKADLIVEVVRSFETIVRLRKQITCDTALLDRAEKLRELTRLRERQGRASRVDTLRIDLQWGQAQTRLEAHREEAASAWFELAELLGQPSGPVPELAPAPLPDLDMPPADSLVATALSNRLDYAQAIDDCRSAQRQQKLARRQLQPDIDLVASHQQYDQDSRFSDSLDFDQSLWSVGLAGQTDLLRRREKTSAAAADVDVAVARETLGIKALTIAREVQQAASDYRQARAELAHAGRNREAALARSELAHKLFEMGRGDHFAVTDAESAFSDAESQWLGARSRTSLAGYRLLRSLGTLTDTPAALKPKAMEHLP